MNYRIHMPIANCHIYCGKRFYFVRNSNLIPQIVAEKIKRKKGSYKNNPKNVITLKYQIPNDMYIKKLISNFSL